MNDKFKLVNIPCGYLITSIIDPTVKVATQILAKKLMRKCRTEEVPKPVILLASQCMIQVNVGGHPPIPLGPSQLSLLVFQFP